MHIWNKLREKASSSYFEQVTENRFRKEIETLLKETISQSQFKSYNDANLDVHHVNVNVSKFDSTLFQSLLMNVDWLNLSKHHEKYSRDSCPTNHDKNNNSSSITNSPATALQIILDLIADPTIIPYCFTSAVLLALIHIHIIISNTNTNTITTTTMSTTANIQVNANNIMVHSSQHQHHSYAPKSTTLIRTFISRMLNSRPSSFYILFSNTPSSPPSPPTTNIHSQTHIQTTKQCPTTPIISTSLHIFLHTALFQQTFQKLHTIDPQNLGSDLVPTVQKLLSSYDTLKALSLLSLLSSILLDFTSYHHLSSTSIVYYYYHFIIFPVLNILQELDTADLFLLQYTKRQKRKYESNNNENATNPTSLPKIICDACRIKYSIYNKQQSNAGQHSLSKLKRIKRSSNYDLHSNSLFNIDDIDVHENNYNYSHHDGDYNDDNEEIRNTIIKHEDYDNDDMFNNLTSTTTNWNRMRKSSSFFNRSNQNSNPFNLFTKKEIMNAPTITSNYANEHISDETGKKPFCCLCPDTDDGDPSHDRFTSMITLMNAKRSKLSPCLMLFRIQLYQIISEITNYIFSRTMSSLVVSSLSLSPSHQLFHQVICKVIQTPNCPSVRLATVIISDILGIENGYVFYLRALWKSFKRQLLNHLKSFRKSSDEDLKNHDSNNNSNYFALLKVYCEIIVECSIFDNPKLCWKVAQPLFTFVVKVITSQKYGHGTTALSSTGISSNAYHMHQDLVTFLLRCIGYVIVRRDNLTSVDQLISNSAHSNTINNESDSEQSFAFCILQLSFYFHDKAIWMYPTMSSIEKELLLSKLISLGVVSFIHDDTEDESSEYLKDKEEQNDETEFPFPRTLSLRECYLRVGLVRHDKYHQLLTTQSRKMSANSSSSNQTVPTAKRSRIDSTSSDSLLEFLNDDVLRHVFSYLTYRRLADITRVCKIFYSLGNEDSFWKQFYTNRFKTISLEDFTDKNTNSAILTRFQEYDCTCKKRRSKKSWRQLFEDKRMKERSLRSSFNREGWKHRTCNVVGCLTVLRNENRMKKHYEKHKLDVAKLIVSLEKSDLKM